MLRAELSSRKLKVSGLKMVLIRRLEDDDLARERESVVREGEAAPEKEPQAAQA